MNTESVGWLLDEMFSLDVELEYQPDNMELHLRRHELGNIITIRLLQFYESQQWSTASSAELWVLVNKLKGVLHQSLHDYNDILNASAKTLQTYRRLFTIMRDSELQREELIQRIDTLLQDSKEIKHVS